MDIFQSIPCKTKWIFISDLWQLFEYQCRIESIQGDETGANENSPPKTKLMSHMADSGAFGGKADKRTPPPPRSIPEYAWKAWQHHEIRTILWDFIKSITRISKYTHKGRISEKAFVKYTFLCIAGWKYYCNAYQYKFPQYTYVNVN